MVVTYERVSTTKQQLERQANILDTELKARGIKKINKRYQDKVTGSTQDRPQLQTMLLELKTGDTVYCESISRLGRNLKDLIDIIETLTAKGVRVIVLKEGIDTSTTTYKLLLAIFGGIAEMERETIQERVIQRVDQLKQEKEATGEIKTKSGKWFGRQEKTVDDLPPNFTKYYERMKSGEFSKVETAKLLECSRATLYRWIKIYEEAL